MSGPTVRVFIQARMSSTRFPGKVLAPFRGRPIIAHVVSRVARVIPSERVVVATSVEESDDPLASYARGLGVPVFRGSLDNVVERLQSCLRRHPCDWFVRVCADSPLVDDALLWAVVAHSSRPDLDLVTNVYPRSFPRGRSLEMILAATFAKLEPDRLASDQREHVTKVYYDHPTRFRILNIESDDPSLAGTSLAVDTVEDLGRLERLVGPGDAVSAVHLSEPADRR